MITFKEYLTEASVDFDMTNMSQKEMGRTRLAKLAGLNLEKCRPYFKKATASNVMRTYNAFVDAFPSGATALTNLKPDGVGPGEVIFYFVFDNVGVGGKNSPIDLFLNGKPWAEAKAGPVASNGTINNFKITKDGAAAVTQLMKDLEAFNHKYEDITGEQLPGWRTAGEISTNALRSWADIDLETLASSSTGGSKKAIDLQLKTDGDLVRKGDEEPILNVKTSKSVKPIAGLIGGGGAVKLSAEEKKISTLEKIVERWVDGAFDEYLDGKLLALIDNRPKTTKLAFFGTLNHDQVGLYTTHRNQPWASVYLNSTRQAAAGGTPATVDVPAAVVPSSKKAKAASDIQNLGASLA